LVRLGVCQHKDVELNGNKRRTCPDSFVAAVTGWSIVLILELCENPSKNIFLV
jgi:hypothetical protein